MTTVNTFLKLFGVNLTYLDDTEYILKTNLSPIEKEIVGKSIYEISRCVMLVGVVVGVVCTLGLVLTYLYLR